MADGDEQELNLPWPNLYRLDSNREMINRIMARFEQLLREYIETQTVRESRETKQAREIAELRTQVGEPIRQLDAANTETDYLRHCCIICRSSNLCVFYPCKHACVCERCFYNRMNGRCPICRRVVVGRIGVYFL